MADGVVFLEDAGERIVAATREVEGMRRNQRSQRRAGPVSPEAPIRWVRVLSCAVGPRYPCRLQDYDGDTDVWFDFNTINHLVETRDKGPLQAMPEESSRYPAQLADTLDAPVATATNNPAAGSDAVALTTDTTAFLLGDPVTVSDSTGSQQTTISAITSGVSLTLASLSRTFTLPTIRGNKRLLWMALTVCPIFVWGILTGYSCALGAYAWQQVAAGTWLPITGGIVGTLAENTAYEINSKNIALGTRVQLFLTNVADLAGVCKRWVFVKDCPPGLPCSGSGSGTGGGGGGAVCGGTTLPTTLYASITNISGLACLDGIILPLTWNGNNYAGFMTACGGQNFAITVSSYPPGSDFVNAVLDMACGGSNYINSQRPDATPSCSPLDLSYTMASPVNGGCGNGRVNVAIME